MILPLPRRMLALTLRLTFAFAPAGLVAEELPLPAPLGKPATKVYRQVLPGGRVVYSDKPVKGAKVTETITVEPPVKGTTSAKVSGQPSESPLRTEPTPVDPVATVPSSSQPATPDDTNADVIRAEMLLEDARKRMEVGVEPLPGERTGTASGGSRLNEAYHARQKRLAEEVAVAENVLKKAIAERDAQSSGR